MDFNFGCECFERLIRFFVLGSWVFVEPIFDLDYITWLFSLFDFRMYPHEA
jgi:hypothetical protein